MGMLSPPPAHPPLTTYRLYNAAGPWHAAPLCTGVVRGAVEVSVLLPVQVAALTVPCTAEFELKV